jgi:hypothetical protein
MVTCIIQTVKRLTIRSQTLAQILFCCALHISRANPPSVDAWRDHFLPCPKTRPSYQICHIAYQLVLQQTGLPQMQGTGLYPCEQMLVWLKDLQHYGLELTLSSSHSEIIIGNYQTGFLLPFNNQCSPLYSDAVWMSQAFSVPSHRNSKHRYDR